MFGATSLLALWGMSSVVHAACGDGEADKTEDCDDGNTDDGDGCDSTCVVEDGWDCVDATFELDFTEVVYNDGHSSPSWSISSDLRTVTQSVNSDAAVYMSTLPATGVTIEMEMRVGTSSDDDFIGFVIGFEAGDGSASSADRSSTSRVARSGSFSSSQSRCLAPGM